jgi:hypothetical protein
MTSALDQVAVKASTVAEQVLHLSPFELGYFAGVLAENHPAMARELAVSINLNLEEIYGIEYLNK